MIPNDFALLFKDHIQKSKYSTVSISNKTNINRTMIQKYMSGLQMPKEFSSIEPIIKLLALSNHQKAELKRAYKIEKIGYLKYQKLEYLKNILKDLNSLGTSTTNQFKIAYDFKHVNEFAKNPEELKLMVHYLYQDAISTNNQIKILINCNNIIFPIICDYARSNPQLQIEQIITLNNLESNDITNTNLIQFQKVLQLLLLNNNVTLEYLYNQNNNLGYYGIFPYMIATQNNILLINTDATLGMLINDNLAYLRPEYDKKHKLAKAFFSKATTNYQQLNMLLKIPESSDYCIYSYQPFIFLWLDTNTFSKHLINNDDERETMINRYQLYQMELENYLENHQITLFFTISGLNSFMHTNIFNSFLTLFSDDELNHLYKQLVKEICNSDKYHINIIDERYLEFPLDTIIINNDNNLVISKDNHVFTIYENTICKDFQLLDKLFDIEECCFNQNKSIELLKEYSRKEL